MRSCQGVPASVLKHMISSMPEAPRVVLIQQLKLCRAQLIEVVTEKFSSWHHNHYSALGMCWCMVGGDVQVSKEVCRRCMDEADDALLAGKYTTELRASYLRLEQS